MTELDSIHDWEPIPPTPDPKCSNCLQRGSFETGLCGHCESLYMTRKRLRELTDGFAAAEKRITDELADRAKMGRRRQRARRRK